MHFTNTLLAALSALTLVTASPIHKRQGVCTEELYTNSVCCDTDILGLATLDCETPRFVPQNGTDFRNICASRGQIARCCVAPLVCRLSCLGDVDGC